MQKPKSFMNTQEYLQYEECSITRHEFVNGQIFAMTGGTNRHNIIVLNLATILRQQVRGTNCRTYVADQKLRIEATNSFYYPDVLVACEAFDHNTTFSERAILIVEVLSKSTSSIDRREKVIAYRQIPTLMEYLIVFQNHQRVQLHRRDENDQWVLLEFCTGEEFELLSSNSCSLRISMEQIYEEVDWKQKDSKFVREDEAIWSFIDPDFDW